MPSTSNKPPTEHPETRSSIEAVQNTFNNISDHYESHFDKQKSGTAFSFNMRRDIVVNLTRHESGTLVDFACGPGEITQEVLKTANFQNAILMDISPAMLAKARKRMEEIDERKQQKIDFLSGDVFTLLKEGKVKHADVVLILGLIAHTGRLSELLQHAYSLLPSGGKVIIQSTLLNHFGTRITRYLTSQRYKRKHGYDISYFSLNDLKTIAKDSGFLISSINRFCFGLPFGDSFWRYGNYYLESLLTSVSSRIGSEAVFLLEKK